MSENRKAIGFRVEYWKNGAWVVLTKANAGATGEAYARDRADELAARAPETHVRVLIVEEAMRVLREYNVPTPGSVGGGACGWG